jgi:hypothetical protein
MLRSLLSFLLESSRSPGLARFFFALQGSFEAAAMHRNPKALLNRLHVLRSGQAGLRRLQALHVGENFPR